MVLRLKAFQHKLLMVTKNCRKFKNKLRILTQIQKNPDVKI